MDPFKPPPSRQSGPASDGWGGANPNAPYINVVRLDTHSGGGAGGGGSHHQGQPQQQQRRPQQGQGQRPPQGARSPSQGARSPSQGARSPSQQRRPQPGARPPPGYQPPPQGSPNVGRRERAGSSAGPKVVPNAVFAASAGPSQPAADNGIRLVPNSVFDSSQPAAGNGIRLVPNSVFDASSAGNADRQETQWRESVRRPEGSPPKGIMKNTGHQQRPQGVPIIKVNQGAGRGGGGGQGQRAQKAQRAMAPPGQGRPSKGGGMTIGARMSTFFGLTDPTGGMYGDEMRSGGRRESNEGIEVPKLNRNAFRRPSGGLDPRQKQPVPNDRLVKGVEQGMSVYNRFIKKEKLHIKKTKPRQSMAASMFSGTMKPQSNLTGTLRRNSLMGANSVRTVSERTMIREELMSLPEFKPVFIRLISLIQFLLVSGMILWSLLQEQFGAFGLSNVGDPCSVETGNCPTKFNGEPDLTAVSVRLFNPWMGPNTNFMIQFNAKYSPCMREDTAIMQSLRLQRLMECGPQIEYANGAPAFNEQCIEELEGFSCCISGINIGQETLPRRLNQSGILKAANLQDYQDRRQQGTRNGMTSLAYCQEVGGLWLQDPTVTANGNVLCNPRYPELDPIPIVIRPCCLGIKGYCELLTKSQCNFRAGIFREDGQLCSDVSCLGGTCTTYIGGDEPAKGHPLGNELDSPNNWHRFIAPLFLHSGAIHFFIMIIFQLYLGSPIERSIGFLRIFLIYFISGIGGYLVSGLFDPYVVSVGSNPAVFGLLGVVLVELLQTWKVVPGAWTKLLKIVTVILIAVIAGSLPFVDNYSQLGGLVFGMLSACIFLPYISLGKWHDRGRKIILCLSGPLLVVLILVCLVMFYAVQDTEWCGSTCTSFNCWEWHSSLSCDGDVANTV